MESAKTRAEWLAALSGLRVEPLVGLGRFLVTSGRPQDVGRLIWVERCDEAECLTAQPGKELSAGGPQRQVVGGPAPGLLR
jgi:hypothetical protein